MTSTKTLKELIVEASELAEESFDNKQWVDWFNSGLDDLAPVLYIDEKKTIAANTDGAFPTPQDLLAVIRIDGGHKNLRMLSPADDNSVGYHMVAGNFELQNSPSSEITLWYYRRPAYVNTATVSEPVDIPDAYTRALIYFACAQGMIREDETERYTIFIEEYNKAKMLIHQNSKARRAGRTGQWQVIR